MKPFMASATATATASASAAAALLGYILLLVSLPYAFSLNGDPSKTSLNTYAGWKSFEVVTQGDKLGGYTVPGQMDGIGAYLMDGGTDLRVFVNHETVRGDELQ
eukprot:scaffold1033_cov205-Alexandrium_tamarense.AAC.13